MTLLPRHKQFDFISNLPTELLLYVVQNFNSKYKSRCENLAALSKVSRRFHDIFNPLLYSIFERCCNQQVSCFSRTISANPTVASYVRRLIDPGHEGYHTHTILYPENDPKTTGSHEHAYPTPHERNYQYALAQATGLDVPELAFNYLTEHKCTNELLDYVVACKCPNIEEITVTGANLHIRMPIAYAISGEAFGKVHGFEKLHTLTIAVDTCRSYPFNDLMFAFKIPLLSSLTIKNAALTGSEEQYWEQDKVEWEELANSKSSTIRRLSLDSCGLDCRLVSLMIGACRELRTFDLEFLHHLYPYLGGSKFYPIIMGALAEHQDSLTDLSILENGGCINYPYALPSQQISVKDYRSLRNLDIPLWVLSAGNGRMRNTGSADIENALPASLRELTVVIRSSREGPSDGYFLSIADALSRGCFTHLESITVICRLESRRPCGPLPFHPCHLERFFASLAVDFVYEVEMDMCQANMREYEQTKSTYKLCGPDGRAIAESCSLEVGCVRMCHPILYDPAVFSPSRELYQQTWSGPAQFEEFGSRD